jgi:hypothetical protein
MTAFVTELDKPLPSVTFNVTLYVPLGVQVFLALEPTCDSLRPLPQSQK